MTLVTGAPVCVLPNPYKRSGIRLDRFSEPTDVIRHFQSERTGRCAIRWRPHGRESRGGRQSAPPAIVPGVHERYGPVPALGEHDVAIRREFAPRGESVIAGG